MATLEVALSNNEIQKFRKLVQLVEMQIVIYAGEMTHFCHPFTLCK